MSQFILSELIYKHKSCEKCRKKHNEASMVLCDRCEDAYHIRCIGLSSVPEDTWICANCGIDTMRQKQEQLMRKRPIATSSMEECRACKNKATDRFQFEMGEDRVLIQARDVNLVKCAYCEQKFHNLCFSDRPSSINCRTCEELIRESIPKGHEAFVKFMKQSQAIISQKKYLELTGDVDCPETTDHTLQLLQLVAPPQLRDWRLLVSYEASLCYALLTREMTYCQNLVVELPRQKLDLVLRAHKHSVERLYKLNRLDQIAYEQFKARLQLGFMPPLEVKEDRKKGFYIVSTAFIPINTILAEYTGELITARQSLSMVTNDNIFALIRNPRSAQSLDIAPHQFANIAIFISGVNNSEKDAPHRQNVRALKFTYQGISRLVLIALRNISARETLYLNYNGDKAIAQYPTNTFVH